MNYLQHINAVLAAACCLRLVLLARSGATHRPWASVLAYLLTVAFGAQAVLAVFGMVTPLHWSQLILNLVLIAAVFSVDGNVVELFRPRDNRQSILLGFLRRETWI